MAHKLDEFIDRTTPQTYHFLDKSRLPKDLLGRVKMELRQRGAVSFNLWLPETRYLAHIIHKDEHIMGSVYGRFDKGGNDRGRGALVATDQRVLFIDKKPLFMHCDEMTFMIIGGVTYTRSAIIGYVTLHTRLGDYKLRTFNPTGAANFVDYIETKCLQGAEKEEKFEHVT
ncbi:MAG: PH domain-containing protein [Candidatus Saccharimonadales bacterium]